MGQIWVQKGVVGCLWGRIWLLCGSWGVAMGQELVPKGVLGCLWGRIQPLLDITDPLWGTISPKGGGGV